MATIVFTSGHELRVTAAVADILAGVTAAQRGGSEGVPAGWIALTTQADGREVQVQAGQIAYIHP